MAGALSQNLPGPQFDLDKRILSGGDSRVLPLLRSLGSEEAQRCSGDQMALKVEIVMDGGVGLVTLADSTARWWNPADDRHMIFQYLTGAGWADPNAGIGENDPNVTSPSHKWPMTSRASLPRPRAHMRRSLLLRNSGYNQK